MFVDRRPPTVNRLATTTVGRRLASTILLFFCTFWWQKVPKSHCDAFRRGVGCCVLKQTTIKVGPQGASLFLHAPNTPHLVPPAMRSQDKKDAPNLWAHLKFSTFHFPFSQMRVSESRANEFALPSGSILDKNYFVNSNRRLTVGDIGVIDVNFCSDFAICGTQFCIGSRLFWYLFPNVPTLFERLYYVGRQRFG